MDASFTLTHAHLERSVMAVPPLARSADGAIDRAANEKIIRHIEAGGVSLLLYGGNANVYHLPLDEYEPLLALLAETAGSSTLVVPSAGPTYGLLLAHAKSARPPPRARPTALRRCQHTDRWSWYAGPARARRRLVSGMPAG